MTTDIQRISGSGDRKEYSATPDDGWRKQVCIVSYIHDLSFVPNLYNGATYLANAGFDVRAIFIAPQPADAGEKTVVPRLTAERIHLKSRRFFHKRFGLAPTNILVAGLQYILSYTEFTIKSFFASLRARADLYEAHDLPALLPTFAAARLNHRPLVYHAHELYSEMHERVRFAGFWRRLEAFLVPRIARVVTPEENRSRIYVEEFHAPLEPVMLRNCPPFRPIIRSTKIRDYFESKKIHCSTVVLYQGLFDTSRCIEELTRATGYFREGIILALIGSGFKEWGKPQAMINRTTDKADKVVIMPRVPYHELHAYTASADIGVLFYRNDCRNNYYCAPNKLHEYMMMGLPVVTCDYPGVKKFVEGENVGLCVNPENPLQIARAINILATSPDLYREMRENCLRLSREKYNWEKEFEGLLDAYGEILHIPHLRNRAGGGAGWGVEDEHVAQPENEGKPGPRSLWRDSRRLFNEGRNRS